MASRGGWVRVIFVAGAATAACKFTNGHTPGGDGGGGGSDGKMVGSDAMLGPCQTLGTSCASPNGLATCTTVGDAPTVTKCGWGCVAGPPAKCGAIDPAGGAVTSVLTDGSSFGSDLTSVTLGSGVIANGDTGEIGVSGNAGSVRRAGSGVQDGIDFEYAGSGAAVAVWRFASLTINGDLTLDSRNDHHPIAFVVNGAVMIANVVDARGFCGGTNAGPGGTPGANAASAATGVGGPGGGHGGTGGIGSGVLATPGGAPFGDDVISTLAGGGGGGGGTGGGMAGSGGGGGGALQIVSNAGIAITSGGINAGGCGGWNGKAGNDGGGGGGAGGTILLEAPSITIAGILAANGGGGGAGNGNTTLQATNGQLGSAAAAGGLAGPGAAGGAGGAGSSYDGAPGGNTNLKGGGGGGAVGRIRLNTAGGAGLTTNGGTLSPPLVSGSPTTQGSAATH